MLLNHGADGDACDANDYDYGEVVDDDAVVERVNKCGMALTAYWVPPAMTPSHISYSSMLMFINATEGGFENQDDGIILVMLVMLIL